MILQGIPIHDMRWAYLAMMDATFLEDPQLAARGSTQSLQLARHLRVPTPGSLNLIGGSKTGGFVVELIVC